MTLFLNAITPSVSHTGSRFMIYHPDACTPAHTHTLTLQKYICDQTLTSLSACDRRPQNAVTRLSQFRWPSLINKFFNFYVLDSNVSDKNTSIINEFTYPLRQDRVVGQRFSSLFLCTGATTSRVYCSVCVRVVMSRVNHAQIL